jgi:hypothetical protein
MSDSRSLSVFQDQGLTPREVEFCSLIADGLPANKALARLGMTKWEYHQARTREPAFESALARARAILQEDRVDRIHEIATTEPDVNRARTIIDGIKWVAGKYNRTFNDKLDITVEHRIDISDALAAARARATLRPMRDPADTIDAEFEALPGVEPVGSIDKQSLPQLPDIFD